MNRRQALGATVLAASVGTAASPAAAAIRSTRTSPTLRRVVAEDGTTLHYRDWGHGPVLVFLASWALGGDMWTYQRIHFAERGYRCVTLDRRGHGLSDAPPSGYDMDTLADDVEALLVQLDLRDVVLIGHSMGGAEVIRYLGRHGTGRVRRVALLAPVAPYIVRTDDNPYGAPMAFHDANFARWARDFPGWAEEGKAAFFTPQTSAPMVDWLFRQLLATPHEVVIASFRALIGKDLRPDLSLIDRPTLVIHGDRDASAPLEITGRRVAAGVPGARLEIVEGGPHGLFVTHMEAVNGLLEDFVRT